MNKVFVLKEKSLHFGSTRPLQMPKQCEHGGLVRVKVLRASMLNASVPPANPCAGWVSGTARMGNKAIPRTFKAIRTHPSELSRGVSIGPSKAREEAEQIARLPTGKLGSNRTIFLVIG